MDIAPAALPSPILARHGPDAALIRLCRRILANRRMADRLIAIEESGADAALRTALLEAALPLAMEGEAMMAELAETPATTLAGLRAKGEVLADHLGLDRAAEPLEEDRIAWSVAEDLLRLIPPAGPRAERYGGADRKMQVQVQGRTHASDQPPAG